MQGGLTCPDSPTITTPSRPNSHTGIPLQPEGRATRAQKAFPPTQAKLSSPLRPYISLKTQFNTPPRSLPESQVSRLLCLLWPSQTSSDGPLLHSNHPVSSSAPEKTARGVQMQQRPQEPCHLLPGKRKAGNGFCLADVLGSGKEKREQDRTCLASRRREPPVVRTTRDTVRGTGPRHRRVYTRRDRDPRQLRTALPKAHQPALAYHGKTAIFPVT